MNKKKLMIVQPILADYRVYFFNRLAQKFCVELFCDNPNNNSGHAISTEPNFKVTNTHRYKFFNERLYFQKGLLKGLLAFKPDAVFITAHPKNISFWLLIFMAKTMGIKTYIHGQGFYNKPNCSFIIKNTYKLMIMLCTKYVCYTESTAKSLKVLPRWCQEKCVVVANTIFNANALSHHEKSYDKKGIFYIGRLRKGSNVELLANAVKMLNEAGNSVVLHIIGTGELEPTLRHTFNKLPYIKFHGKIFDQSQITEISKECFIGCYPGHAGLSIVHHMSLSLPTLVHSDMAQHMGPEPSYVNNNVNGFLFDDYTTDSILKGISKAFHLRNTVEYSEVGFNAFNTYKKLINPDFSDKLAAVIKRDI